MSIGPIGSRTLKTIESLITAARAVTEIIVAMRGQDHLTRRYSRLSGRRRTFVQYPEVEIIWCDIANAN